MFYSLRGTLVHYDGGGDAVECGGVAYYCQSSLSTVAAIGSLGDEVLIYTYMHVREGAVDLFGFAEYTELACFKMLIGVTGVGPKAALSILSQMSPERFALGVASGDHKALTVAQGVGPKLAQRIILELRDKVQSADIAKGITQHIPANVAFGTGNAGEAVSALVVLGYSQSDAASAIARLAPDTSVEDMIKAGLKALAGSR